MLLPSLRFLCGIVGFCLALSPAPLARADEFDVLRMKWSDQITGGDSVAPSDPAAAPALASLAASANGSWSSMNKSPSRTYLWSDAASTTVSGQMTTNFTRLRTMALAYATPGCSLRGNTSLRDDILAGLDWLRTNRYNENKAIYDNWWDFEIGTPQALVDIAVLLYPDLSASQLSNYMRAVEKFTPSATTPAAGGSTGTFTGANRMWKISIVTLRGILVKDPAKIAAARDAFSNLFPNVASGDGFYADGSFLQHVKHPYTGGYGSSLLSAMSQTLVLLNGPNSLSASGSTWKVTDPNLSAVHTWIFRSFAPLLYRGALMDMVRGREISRNTYGDHATGHGVLQSILRISQFAPPGEAARMRSLVKYWAGADTARSFTGTAPLSILATAQQLMADNSVTPANEPVGCFLFASMDRAVHLRPGFGLGLSLSSSRIYTYESINQENLHGWHTGDGMLYLYNADLTQFSDSFWQTVNPRRLPGTTVDATQTRADGSGQSTTPSRNWVGGATLGGLGAVGMELAGWNSSLTARKSWFLLDDEVICLGSGITSTDSRTIETTVDNRLLASAGTNLLTVDGVSKPASLGWSENLAAVSWAHLAGRVPGSDIGYWFPSKPPLKMLREARTGVPYDINNRYGSTTPVTRNYLTLWFDHGGNPSGATYAYVLLPNRSAAQVAAYAGEPQIQILSNSPAAQAIRKPSLGLTAANFWADGGTSVGGITSDRKASVLVRENGNYLQIALSDPTQANTGSITIELNRAVLKPLGCDDTVTVLQTSPTLRLSVNVNRTAGRSHVASFQLAAGNMRLLNLSTNTDCQADVTLTSGFVIEGSGSQGVLVRAVGPGLAPYGVATPLPDPKLVLNDINQRRVLLRNDDWSTDPVQAELLRSVFASTGAFPILNDSRDAAILTDLPPGLYTAETTSSQPGQAGQVLTEVYKAGTGQNSRFVNLSTRKFCQPGSSIVCGFVLDGDSNQRVLIRAIGPGLTGYGVNDAMQDPRLILNAISTRSVLAENDNWGSDSSGTAALRHAFLTTGAFSLLDGSRDAALLADLPPGLYTAEGLSAIPSQGGSLLVEVYLVD